VRDARTPGQQQADGMVDLLLAGARAGDGNPQTPLADPGQSVPRDEAAPDHESVLGDQSAPGDQLADDPGSMGGEAPEGGGRAVIEGPGFVAGAVSQAEVCVIATVDQVAAAFGADDPAARGVGLARMSLAGRVGDYPGSTVQPAVLARLSCDSPIRRILVDEQGAVLHHGRARRFASPVQKRALAVRDGGCVIPGCPAPPERCDVHHVIPWEWQDPHRRWLPNTTHHHPRLADLAARTLLRPPPPPWNPEQTAPDAA
jgi:hypothetical protein